MPARTTRSVKKTRIDPAGVKPKDGPYSPGIVVGDMVFVSGQGPLAPGTRDIKGRTIGQQTRVTLDNVKAVLKAAGCTFDDVVKVTAHLSDMANFDDFNKEYVKHFKRPRPTRTTVQSVLWHNILVEIDVIAIKGCGGR